MLNSINSYSKHTYTNLTNSQINANTTNVAPFAKDKSQAVSTSLGYGVDSEGFFTSDFNEAVGLDKDYKIYAKGVENLAKELSTNKHFSKVDLTQTLNNAYKIFSQLVPNAPSYDKEQIAQIALGFDYDKKTLQVKQIYTSPNELLKAIKANDSYKSPTQTSLVFPSLTGDLTKRADDIFDIGGVDLGKSAYELTNGEIAKGGLFMAFANAQIKQNGNGYLISGDTTMSGKMMGFDKNLSKKVVEDLNEFVSVNAFLGGNTNASVQEKFARMMKVMDLFEADLSVDEFKSQWLGLINGTAKLDENELKSFGEIIDNFMKENGIQNTTNSNANNAKSTTNSPNSAQTNTEQNTTKKRSPIQVTSKSEIYKDMDLSRLQNILKNQHKFDLINILFGTNSNINAFNANGTDLNTNLMNLNLSQIKPLSRVDIKA